MPVQPTGSQPTQTQIDMYNLHREICAELGIPQFTLGHRGLVGTETNATYGNVVYTPPGPITDYKAQYKTTWQVWMVNQVFIRGLEREDDTPAGSEGQSYLQGQCPAIDDNYNFIDCYERDHLIDPNSQWIYIITNPSLDPSGSFWSFILERQR